MDMFQLVPLEVGTATARIWVGSWLFSSALHAFQKLPLRLRVEQNVGPRGPLAGEVAEGGVVTSNVQLPAGAWNALLPHYEERGGYQIVELSKLGPGRECNLRLEAQLNEKDGWRAVPNVSATFDTLPLQLPRTGNGQFGIAFGSCFYEKEDNGKTALAYKKIHNSPDARPNIKLLLGDQVYLDLELSRWAPHRLSTQQIRELILRRYSQNWLSLGSMLKRGGTWFLVDDHEIWDDYPFTSTLPFVAPILTNDDMRHTWELACKNAASSIQGAAGVFRHTSVGNLSIGVLDTRFERTEGRFVAPDQLAALTDWLAKATGPTVLAMQQLMFRKQLDHGPLGIGAGHQLSSFEGQYAALANAIIHAPHDVVLLTGDVHFGRVAQVEVEREGQRNHKIIEIVSSPFSNFVEFDNKVSRAAPDKHPDFFPPGDNPPVKFKVNYQEAISTRAEGASREHFVTAHFSTDPDGSVLMNVRAWRIRTNADTSGLPVIDYEWQASLA
jgi:hypothetical protein